MNKKAFVVLMLMALIFSACIRPSTVAPTVATVTPMAPLDAAALEPTVDARGALPEVEVVVATPDVEATVEVRLQAALAAQPTATPVLVPIPAEQDPLACVNKLYTYPANTEGILYEFEVQSQIPQLNDFYTPGNPTVIVLETSIKPEERSAYALGWGSAWSFHLDRKGCENFDVVANAAEHAQSRMDQGHAGLVIDFRDGSNANVVAMADGMTQERANQLWQMYVQAGHDGNEGQRSLPASLTFPANIIALTAPSPQALQAGVCKASPNRAIGVSGGSTTLGPWDMPVNVQLWWGDSSKAPSWAAYQSGQINFIVPPNTTYVFNFNSTDVKGGGRWDYSGCTWPQIEEDLNWSGLPVYYLDVNGKWVEGMMPEALSQELTKANAVINVPPGVFATPTP